MVSRIIALKALSKLTGIPDLNVIHKVLFINRDDVGAEWKIRHKNPDEIHRLLEKCTIQVKGSGYEEEDEEFLLSTTSDGKIKWIPGVCECYMLCSQSHVYIFELDKLKDKDYADQINELNEFKERKNKLMAAGEEEEEKEEEEEEEEKASREATIPTHILLSSCHRKMIIEDLQIAHDTLRISANSQFLCLQHEFLPMNQSKKYHLEYPAFRTLSACRHPAIMFLNQLPAALKVNMKPFYRCGYLFLGKSQTTKISTTGTAARTRLQEENKKKDQTSIAAASSDMLKRKRMLVRMMPEKPIRSGAPDSNLDFHLWVESIAWGLAKDDILTHEMGGKIGGGRGTGAAAATDATGGGAMGGGQGGTRRGSSSAAGKSFTLERGVYRKKMNITGDESMYHCFRLHILTPYREIGVIGVRRKYIPPYIDSFQDMIFVLKGTESKANKLDLEPHFMTTLERIVDTLSPSAVNWGADSCWTTRFQKSPKEPHPTYIDSFLIQHQVDALLCNDQVYSWLRHRAVFPNIVPKFKINGAECNRLAMQFCRSVCMAAHDGKNFAFGGRKSRSSSLKKKGGAGHQQSVSVIDPMSILKRFETEAAHVLDGESSSSYTVNQGISGRIRQVLLNNWSRGRFGVEAANNFKCNETVLLKLLDAGYFEDGKLNRPGGRGITRKGKNTTCDAFTCLLKSLLIAKSNNLIIVRAVCRKIKRQHQSKLHADLIKPLLNLVYMGNEYAQTYAFQVVGVAVVLRIRSDDTDSRNMSILYKENTALSATLKAGHTVNGCYYDDRGVEMAMHVMYTSPSRELVQAAASYLETIISKFKPNATIRRVSKIYFLDKLVALMAVQNVSFKNDYSLLVMILLYLVTKGLVKELIAIIEDHENYYRILTPISACLGTIIYKLYDENNMKSFNSHLLQDKEGTGEVSEFCKDLPVYSQVLVTTLKEMMNPEGMQVVLNLVIALKYIIKIVPKEGELDDSKKTIMMTNCHSQSRRKLLTVIPNDLDNHYAFEHILARCINIASRCQDILEKSEDDEKMVLVG
eukprot:jgi/Bigna1/75327/fgenesh1_pg.34_\